MSFFDETAEKSISAAAIRSTPKLDVHQWTRCATCCASTEIADGFTDVLRELAAAARDRVDMQRKWCFSTK